MTASEARLGMQRELVMLCPATWSSCVDERERRGTRCGVLLVLGGVRLERGSSDAVFAWFWKWMAHGRLDGFAA